MASTVIEEQINELIQIGAFSRAKEILIQAREKQGITLLPFTRFCRRLGLFNLALNALRPKLYAQNVPVKSAPENLWVEYANHLTLLGLTQEAESHLKRVTDHTSYAVCFAWGLLRTRQGDFQKAIEVFGKALNSKDGTEYEKNVALANRLNALLGCFQYESVIEEAKPLMAKLVSGNNANLLGWSGSCVAQAQAYLGQARDFEIAFQNSTTAYQMNREAEIRTPFELSILRWEPIGRLLCQEKSPAELKKLSVFREQAKKFGDWEIFRDLSIFDAYFKKDFAALQTAYFGSPSPFQKQRIERWAKELQFALEPVKTISPAQIAYCKSTFPQSGKQSELSLARGTRGLKPGQLPHRILKSLLQDWYRPLRLYEIYNFAFGEKHYFDPVNSPNRIHQGVKRLNKILKQEKIPVQVISKNDFYELHFQKSVQIKLSLLENSFLEKWREYFQSRPVQLKIAANKLGITQRSLQMKIKEFETSFEIKKEGRNWFYQYKD